MLALSATAAFAADHGRNDDWSGFYAGVHGGLGSGSDHSVFAIDPAVVPSITIKPDIGLNGGFAGVQVGFDHQMGGFVFGVEGRISSTNLSGSNAPAGFGGAIDKVNGKYEASLLGRIGYAFDGFLPYVTAGVSALNYDRQVSVPPAVSSANSTAAGFSIGIGGKFAINRRLELFAEYLHTGYALKTTKTPGIPAVFGETIHDTITTDKVLFGISRRF